MIDYNRTKEIILVKHIPTGEIYEAILLSTGYKNTYTFQITGDRKHNAKLIIESDNLEVDTYFTKSWIVLKRSNVSE